MNQAQKNNIENLHNNMNILWTEFTSLFPIANNVINKKELRSFRKNFAEKYKNLCESNADVITSSCLLERFVCSFNSNQEAVEFKSEIASIAATIEKALSIPTVDGQFTKKIQDIVKNMIITLEANPLSRNNDYRNRLNEILVYIWLSECENIKVTFIERKLDNGKSCDFECKHTDGTTLLFDVYSINNLQVEKQEDSNTFSNFINQKVEKKFDDKTKNLSVLPNLRIIPVLEYTEGLETFDITVNGKLATPPLTVIKNTVNGVGNIYLGTLKDISDHFREQDQNRFHLI